MQVSLNRYILLVKRWTWLVILGIFICGSAAYVVSRLLPPVYQASAILIIDINSSTSASDNVYASELAVPTFAQLLTTPAVLEPVVAMHEGMTLRQLISLISVQPQSNTQLIELDVENGDPQLAMQLANEISQSFVQFASPRLHGVVQVVPAKLPTEPIRPKPLQDTNVGALVGLGLALALIVIFEWIDDLPTSFEEVQELLDMDVLTVIPQVPRRHRQHASAEVPAVVAGCHLLSTSLNAAQSVESFKLVMVTSTLAGEGKSTIAVHLASCLAVAGKSVLLVDANLRSPALDQHFQLEKHEGFSKALLKVEALPEGELCGQTTSVPALRVLPAGILPTDPAELLESAQAGKLFDSFQQTPFDYIIFDTPPLLPVADAQILASRIQVIVLVVNASKTSRRMLLRAKRILQRMHTNVLGVAINKSPWPGNSNVRSIK